MIEDDRTTDDDTHVVPNPNAPVYMLRTVQQHHVQLSAMADQKAGFLIGGMVVLLGIVVSTASRFPSPTIIALGITTLVVLWLAVLAVAPRQFTPDGARPNTLFFGGFAQMDEDEFVDRHLELMRSETRIEEAMLRDIHQMGRYLAEVKFRYLGLAYRATLIGAGITIVVGVLELTGVIPSMT